jgi:hypothetical protein
MAATPIDPLGRAGALAIAVARIAIGVGATAVTRPALRLLGFSDPGPAAVVLARLAGGRDIAMGIHSISARDDRVRLREASLLAAAVDAGDAIAFAALAARDGEVRVGAMNASAGAAGAISGALIAARLSR